MDESTFPLPIAPHTSAHRDRSTGLLVFGILTILLGAGMGLMVLLIAVSLFLPNQNLPNQPPVRAMIPAILIYGPAAVALIWLGIGSILARRWARALLVIGSWVALLVGIFAVVIAGATIPYVVAHMPAPQGSNHLPPASMELMMAMVVCIMAIFLIGIPIVWILFYKSRHVKTTCELRNPAPSWTDRFALPVLALLVWAAISCPMMLFYPFSMHHSVMPMFGILLVDLPAGCCYGVMAILWGIAAWQIFQLKPLGWWLAVIITLFLVVSWFVTIFRNGIIQLLQVSGYTQAQVDQLKDTGITSGNNILLISCVSIMPWLLYLLYTKRYFHQNTSKH